MLLALK